jgi:hypothetical protein
MALIIRMLSFKNTQRLIAMGVWRLTKNHWFEKKFLSEFFDNLFGR